MIDHPVNGSPTTLSLPAVWSRLRLRWGFVVLGALVCALAAWIASSTLPNTYVSTAALIVSPPPFKDAPVPGAKSQTPPQGIGELLPAALPVEAYKAIALSPALVEQVLDAVKPANVDVSTLRKRMEVELVQLGSRSVQTGVAYAPALLFHVRATESEEAAALVQTWTKVFKEQVDEVARGGLNDAFGSLDKLNTRFSEDVRRSDDAIEAHQKTWDVDLMKAEILSEQTLLVELKAECTRLAIELSASEMRQKTLEEELSHEPQKYVYFRAPSDDVYWLAGLEGLAPETGLRTEEPNLNYTTTRSSLVRVREEVAGLRSEREATLAKVEELDAELKGLVAVWAEQNAVRERLLREQESLRLNHDLVRGEYEKGRMAQETLSSNIVLCGAATTSKGPGHSAVTLIAALTGALLTAGALLLMPSARDGALAPIEAKPANGSKKTARRATRALKSDDVDAL